MEQYIEVLPEFSEWTREVPLPDLSIGPTAVEYKLETAKKENVNVQIKRASESGMAGAVIEVFNQLNEKKFTEKSLLQLISIALCLKSKTEDYVFSLPDENYFTLDTSAVNDNIPVPSRIGDITTTLDAVSSALLRTTESSSSTSIDMKSIIEGDKNILYSGPYWASSFLKLICKETENWRRAMNAVQTQFGTFYGMTSSFITSYIPHLSHAEQVKTAMDTFKRVSRIIVSVAATTEQRLEVNSRSHHMFIYFVGQHLSFTGMSVYPMITMIMHKLRGMDPAHILSLLTVETTRESLRMFFKIARTHDAPSNVERKQRSFLWKYARLINEGFFLQLQNKRNLELLYGLVLLTKKLGLTTTGSYADPENMAVLSGKTSIKEEATEFAEAVYTLYKSQVAAGPGASGTERFIASRRGINIPKASTSAPVSEKRPMEVDQPAPAKKKKMTADEINAALSSI